MYLNMVVDTMAITDGSSIPQQVKLDTPLSCSGLTGTLTILER